MTDASLLFDVPTPALTNLVFTVQPAGAVAGQCITPSVQVTIQDGTGISPVMPASLVFLSAPRTATPDSRPRPGCRPPQARTTFLHRMVNPHNRTLSGKRRR